MNGILCINKPKGMTSRDVVNIVGKALGTRKIGHTGTLDPDVDGVLVLCVNRATKLVEDLTSDNKEYIATVKLGFSTTTEDASGEIVEVKKVENISKVDVLKALEQLHGPLKQIPPMYSAIKVNGKRLYEYARAGILVERPVRDVFIHQLEMLSDLRYNEDTVEFDLFAHVGKGTYIRTLSVQIGEILGYPAHMSNLRRIKQGNFTLEQCFTLDEVKAGQYEMISMSEALKHKPSVNVDDYIANKVSNGAILNHFENIDGEVVVYHNSEAIAIYNNHPTLEGKIKPVKVL